MGIKFLTVAFASVLAFNAQANTTDWGTHGTLELGSNLSEAGDINDIFKFVLGESSSVVSSAVSLGSPGLLNISNGAVKLYKEAGAEDTFLGSYTFDGTTGSTYHYFDLTSPGEYYYNVVGQATGSIGGFYSLSSATTPVPEPTTLAMTLAGLVAAGSMYRRRQQS
ncbi:FxDxF family PEP-CTERM protein [Aquabacterium sp. CECT 9606]|uniref:FxDxF family PEP-CTERM protein n=1 Tax=Aquabacterium sp. CECT 9606 TaxID=2845822 RepID=UPI001E2E842E|nr:FxDxF family PEP-CTERM protein [Aquabacterium sp. CECT 9606]CAH0354756.1 hypothetical protein AQB9606_03924 [Aquabacterium sp. CECT 9606]